MYFEQYGERENPMIVFLHGAYFVHSFGRQYSLAKRYCLIVPHIMGCGNETDKVFNATDAAETLTDFIRGLNGKVTIIGFSLGAQLAVKMVAEHEELFKGAIIVSPWLIKEEPMLSKAYRKNVRQLRSLKNKILCNIIGFMNGLPKAERKAFVNQMQNVTEKTLRNTVYNGITFEVLKRFSEVTVPVIALAGEKEQKEVTDSVLGLQQMNRHCKAEIWKKAGHNIPPLFHERFNALISEFVEKL